MVAPEYGPFVMSVQGTRNLRASDSTDRVIRSQSSRTCTSGLRVGSTLSPASRKQVILCTSDVCVSKSESKLSPVHQFLQTGGFNYEVHRLRSEVAQVR
jgi:DNA-binding transcriptional MocR family regulator